MSTSSISVSKFLFYILGGKPQKIEVHRILLRKILNIIPAGVWGSQ